MRVLISGAGIAGPTLAWWLARLDHQVTIIDISRGFLAQGQNVDMSAASIEIARKMGIKQKIKEFNTTEEGTSFINRKGKTIADFPLKGGASPTSPYEILRGDLAMILADATKDHPNVEYIFETSVANVIHNDDRGVKVELTNGDVRVFDIAIAADGQWSNLRRKTFPADAWKVVDKQAYIAYYTVPRVSTDEPYWRIQLGLNRRIVTVRPDSHGTTRACLSFIPRTPEQKAEWDAASRSHAGLDAKTALLKAEFADCPGELAPRLLAALDPPPTDFYMQALKQIHMPCWSAGRVICLGDAAFAPTPLTGMGTSLAFTGAYCLAGELSKLDFHDAEKGVADPVDAFHAYEKMYRPFVEKIQDVPWFVPGIVHPYNAVHRWLLETVMSTLSKAISISWISKYFNDERTEEDCAGFRVPYYARLEKLAVDDDED